MTEPNRRDFLKTSTAAIATVSLLQGISSRAYAAGSDQIKVGLIGCGGRGTGAAAQALSTKGQVKLTAMGDVFRENIDNALRYISEEVSGQPDTEIDVEETHKFVGFDAYKQVVDSGVDLVILATPPGLRPLHYEYAVAQGKNIFMEKPVAVDGPGVQRVLDATRIAKEKGLKVGVGLQRRHQAHYLETMARLHKGDFGSVQAIRVYWNGGGVWDPRVTHEEAKSEMEYQVKNWYYYNWLCGDHIVEQHIHNLDIGNWAKGEYPVSCIGMGGRQVRTDKKYGEIYDHFACQYKFADNTVMFSECRHISNTWSSVSEHIHTEKGLLNISDGAGTEFVPRGQNDKIERIRRVNNNPYQVEHDNLFAAIRNSEEFNEAEYGAKSTLTAILGRLATYSGKEISFEDALTRGIDLSPKSYAWDAEPPTLPDAEGRYPIPVPGVTRVLRDA